MTALYTFILLWTLLICSIPGVFISSRAYKTVIWTVNNLINIAYGIVKYFTNGLEFQSFAGAKQINLTKNLEDTQS